MTAQDIATVIRRVEAKRDRIEGDPPPEFDDLIERLEILGESLNQCPTLLFARYEHPTSFAVAMACAQSGVEREYPSMANRMLTDAAIELALRFMRAILLEANR